MNPDPVIVPELIVTAEVPVEVIVNDCVTAVFTVTLPKLRLPVLTVSCEEVTAVPVPVVCVAELTAPDPQPDVMIVKQHAKANRRAFPHPSNRRRNASGRMWCPFFLARVWSDSRFSLIRIFITSLCNPEFRSGKEVIA